MSEEARAVTAELKKKQITGGDWYKMDQNQSEGVNNSQNFDIDTINMRTTTPLPGCRDSDLETSALPSARHAVKQEYSEYVKLAKQGGHQGLLASESVSNEQNLEKVQKTKISETDSEYVKIAKTGGHADLLKMEGVKEETSAQKNIIKEHDSEYVRMAKTGGHADLLKNDGVQVVDSPRKNYIKDTDSEYVRLAKTGGHQGLLQSDVANVDKPKCKLKDTDSAYIKLAKTGGHTNLLAHEKSSINEIRNPRRNVISEEDTAYVKLAKKGGDSNLLKMNDAKPSTEPVRYKNTSSDWFQHDEKRAPAPITTGKGRGARNENNNNHSSAILPSRDNDPVAKSGKRLFQPTSDRNPPFALHY